MTAPPEAGALACQQRRVGIAVFDSGSRDREQVLPLFSIALMRSGVLAFRVAPSHDRIVVVGAGPAEQMERVRTMAQNMGLVLAVEDTGSIGVGCRVVFDHPPAVDPVATDPLAREP
jgi:hypothetical protein